MDFTLSPSQLEWQQRAQSFARELPAHASALDIVAAAARAGLVDPRADLLASAVAVEAVAWESTGAAIALALHTGVISGLADGETIAPLVRGEVVGAIALSSDGVPTADGVTLVGRASWVTPLTTRGLAIVGVRSGDTLAAAESTVRSYRRRMAHYAEMRAFDVCTTTSTGSRSSPRCPPRHGSAWLTESRRRVRAAWSSTIFPN